MLATPIKEAWEREADKVKFEELARQEAGNYMVRVGSNLVQGDGCMDEVVVAPFFAASCFF